MKMHHRPWHWLAVAAVLAMALFTYNEAHGQVPGRGDGAGPTVPRDPGLDRPRDEGRPAQRDRGDGNVVKRERAENPGKDVAPGKAKKAAKRTVERTRRKVPAVD